MIKHFLKSSIKFLNKNRAYTIINILSLSIALAVSFIILIYVLNELSFDHCHKRISRIYRINSYYVDYQKVSAGTPYILASALKDEFPQVETAANTAFIQRFSIKVNNQYIKTARAVGSTSEIFDIFTIPIISKNSRKNLLEEINSIVVSRSMAEKIWPGINPVNMNITALLDGKEMMFLVTGVFEDLPANSTFHPSCFVNSKLIIDQINLSLAKTDAEVSWNYDFWNTWILMRKGNKSKDIENKIRSLEKYNLSEKTEKKYILQNLSNLYLKSNNIINSGIKGDINRVKIFSIIALLIILVATINYIILSIALSTGRTKEVGIRKTYGAEVGLIRKHLLGESILLSIAILPIAFVTMFLAIPFAEKLFQIKLTIEDSLLIRYVIICILLTIFVGVVSGLYVSHFLSKLNVLEIFNNNIHFGKKRHLFRSLLIIAQLIIFCSFTSCALIIKCQYNHAINKNVGYFKEDVLFIHTGINFKGYNTLVEKIKSNSYVYSASGLMEELPLVSSMTNVYSHFTEKDKDIVVEGLAVDYNFLETMGIKLQQGRDFSKDFGSDFNSVILNQKAVKELGIKDPIGKKLLERTIIGVVNDFNLHSIHSDISPLEIHLSNRIIQDIAIHYEHNSFLKLIQFLKGEWQNVAPNKTFEYSTIEEVISELYSSEKNLTTVISISAFFALLISSLGLLGLTLFTARSHTKEIGIRKIFGGSEHSIIHILIRDNALLVIISNLISVPITLIIMNKWLSNFSTKTSIYWWIFLLTFFISFLIVIMTIFQQSKKAARINPIDALKYS